MSRRKYTENGRKEKTKKLNFRLCQNIPAAGNGVWLKEKGQTSINIDVISKLLSGYFNPDFWPKSQTLAQ